MLGGGIVACELAQFLQRMGTKVTQIQRSPRILKEMSPEASAVIEEAFRDGGLEVITDTQLTRIERIDNGFTAHFTKDGKEQSVTAKHVCNALGRRPNVDGLNLKKLDYENRTGVVFTDPQIATGVINTLKGLDGNVGIETFGTQLDQYIH